VKQNTGKITRLVRLKKSIVSQFGLHILTLTHIFNKLSHQILHQNPHQNWRVDAPKKKRQLGNVMELDSSWEWNTLQPHFFKLSPSFLTIIFPTHPQNKGLISCGKPGMLMEETVPLRSQVGHLL